MMMIVIRLIVFGAHKEKLVAALSPGCLNMRCLPKKFYALTLVGGGWTGTNSVFYLKFFAFTFSLCHFHLGFMIVRAGHDPTENPDFLCKPFSLLLCSMVRSH